MTSTCPACDHQAEGITRSAFVNRLRSLVGLRPLVPQCSSYSTNGMGDVKMCGCEHRAHAQRVAESIYDA